MSVYKPCDIRGPVAELSPELYRTWGASLARRVEPGTRFVIGGDVRTTTPGFLAALEEGLVAGGLHVLNTGVAPTPMVYFAKDAFGAAACAIVTASHNPPDINGLKWMFGNQPPTEQEVHALRDAVDHPPIDDRPLGVRESIDPTEAYSAWLAGTLGDGPRPENMTVVVDPGNGSWSGRAVPALAALFPGIRVMGIHDTPDGTFPNRNADCSRPQYLSVLSEAVVAQGAALGIAFDGDGDRVAFVDNEGVGLSAEEGTCVLLNSFGEALSGQAFVYDIKFSDRVSEAASGFGAEPLAERSGHAFIRARIQATDALFGAEISGHYFYGALESRDDGLYSACRMLCHLAREGRTLAELRHACPPIHMTPDLRVTVALADQPRVIEAVKAAFADRPQRFVDGVRVDFEDGWALVRASVTEPALTFRFEGASADALARIADHMQIVLEPLRVTLPPLPRT